MSLRHATDTLTGTRDENVTGHRVAGSQSHRPPSGGEATHSAVVFSEEALCVGPVCG